MRHETLTLTPNEWLVLEQLWKRPSTLTELVKALGADPPGWAKSTTATMIRRLEDKGLVRHEDGERAKVFHPCLAREDAALSETKSLLNKVFNGSVGLLVNTLAAQESLSKADIDALYAILEEAEGKEGAK